jgi:uncharacterized protein (TIGR03382 family)
MQADGVFSGGGIKGLVGLAVRRLAVPLLVGAAVAIVFLPLVPSSDPIDLNVFLHAGRAILDGHAVYPPPGSAAVYSGTSFVYPVFAAWAFVPLALLSSGAASAVFFVISVAVVLAACFAASEGDPWRAALVLGAAFTITGLQLGALSPLLFAGALFLWLLRDRPLAFALLAAPVIAVKLFLAPLLLWPLLARRRRAFVYACGATLALLGVSFVVGPISISGYVHLLSRLSGHEAQSGFSLIGALMSAGLPSGAADGVAAACALAVVGLSWLQWRRKGSEAILFCGALASSLILTPVLWSHYLVLLFAGAFALQLPRRWVVVLALASWAIAPPHGVHPDMDVIAGVTSSTTWLLVLVAAGVAWYVDRQQVAPAIAFSRSAGTRPPSEPDHGRRAVRPRDGSRSRMA